MPIYYWFKIFETQELNNLIIEGDASQEDLQVIWEGILKEYFEVFGYAENYIKFLQQTKKIVLLEIEYALHKRGSDEFKINYEKNKLEGMNPTKGDKVDYMEIITMVEDGLKRDIDEKSISVRKFYTYKKQVERWQK